MNIRSRVDTYEEEVEQDHATMNFMGANVYWPPDCPEGMLKDIITYVKDFDEDTDPLEKARKLKTKMDNQYNPYWHVACGKNFGCYAIHEARHFVFFYYGELAYLVYKAG